MRDIDRLQDAVMMAVAAAAAHEGTALGVGDTIDEIPSALIGLRHASRRDFVDRYAVVNKALHRNWDRRVGTASYKKSLWMVIDNAMNAFAREVSILVGFEGTWVPVERPTRPARSGDLYRFTYPVDRTLRVARTSGDSPEDLVFFEDLSHSTQKNLTLSGVERVSS